MFEMTPISTGMHLYRQGALTLIEVENAFAYFQMTTHGASVLRFCPKTGQNTGGRQGVSKASMPDVLWVSERAQYHGQKPVRGGIPICWPWFGVHEDPAMPAHGFVRNMTWQLVGSHTNDQAHTCLELKIAHSAHTLALWPYRFALSLWVEVGPELKLTLVSHNHDDKSFALTEAFHSYFQVSQAEKVFVSGLQGSECHDKLTDLPPYSAEDTLSVQPPLDRVYLQQRQPLVLHDPGYKREIHLVKTSAHSSVVWNPGPSLVKGLDDMDDQAWSEMLCVESGNVLTQGVTLQPGQTHQQSLQISVQAL